MATVKVALMPDNSLLLSVTEGADYPGAKEKIEALVASLNVQGFSVKLDGEVEAHRHDGKLVTVAGHQHAH
jgi:hypothetical protein